MKYKNIWHRLDRINPTVWLFFGAVFIFLVGASLNIKVLFYIGGFLLIVFLVIALAWAWFIALPH